MIVGGLHLEMALFIFKELMMKKEERRKKKESCIQIEAVGLSE